MQEDVSKQSWGSIMPWSSIKSRVMADLFCHEGRLVKTLLLPQAFGGEDVPENTTYLPEAAWRKKEQATADLASLVRQGLAERVSVTPEYQDDSFIPTKIRIVAWRDDHSGRYQMTIDVW